MNENKTPTPAANSEPQADITPADYAAVEAMGETEANVFGKEHIEPEWSQGMSDEEYTALVKHARQNTQDVPASNEIASEDAQPEGAVCPKCNGAKKVVYIEAVIDCPKCDGTGFVDAQTAPVDGGSDGKLLKCEHGILVPYCAECYEKDMDGNSIGKTYMANKLLREHSARQAKNRAEAAKTHEQREIERQHAEIRTLESKLAAAAAALYVSTSMLQVVADKVANSETVTYIDVYDMNRRASQNRETLAKLSALQQSGADEGK